MKNRKQLRNLLIIFILAIALPISGIHSFIPSSYAQSATQSNSPSKPPLRYLLQEGDGSSSSPYQIWNEDDLRNVWIMGLENYYILMDDIDLASDWEPIGASSSKPFTGNFDGNGHTIRNVNIKGGNNLGFFGFISKATIRNLNLENVTLEGYSAAIGGLVANAAASLISNCSIKNSNITHLDTAVAANVGGLVGYLLDSKIEGSHIKTANVSDQMPTSNIGGLVGYVSGGSIKSSYIVDPAVYSANSVNSIGGFVGNASETVISQSYAANVSLSIKGTSPGAGGFAGQMIGGSFNQCFSTGQVDISGYHANAGGFCGKIESNDIWTFNITDCYSTCDISTQFNNLASPYYVGGFAGYVGLANTLNGGRTSYNLTSMINRVYASGIVKGNNASGLLGYLAGSSRSYYLSATYTVIHNIILTNSVALPSKVTTSIDAPYRIVASLGAYATLTNNYGLIDGQYFGTGEGAFRDPLEEELNLRSGQNIRLIDAKRKITYEKQANWNFDTIWAIDEDNGYPYLQFAGNIVNEDPSKGEEAVDVPAKATKLTAEEKDGKLVLTWNKVSDAEKYEVYINGVAHEAVTESFIIKDSLTPSDVVTVYVVAVNSVGKSQKSMELTVKIPEPVVTPDADLNLIDSSFEDKENRLISTEKSDKPFTNIYDTDTSTWWAGGDENRTTIELSFNQLITFNEIAINEYQNRIENFSISYEDEDGVMQTLINADDVNRLTLKDNETVTFDTFGDIVTKKVVLTFKRFNTAQNLPVAIREMTLCYKR